MRSTGAKALRQEVECVFNKEPDVAGPGERRKVVEDEVRKMRRGPTVRHRKLHDEKIIVADDPGRVSGTGIAFPMHSFLSSHQMG